MAKWDEIVKFPERAGLPHVHVCTFEACNLPKGRKLTYEAFTDAVVAAGRFSVFEATATLRVARMFTRMAKDPRFVFEHIAFPWTIVRRKEAETCPSTSTGA